MVAVNEVRNKLILYYMVQLTNFWDTQYYIMVYYRL